MARIAAAFLLLLALAAQAFAAEEILSYDSRVEAQLNGDLRVTETIRVRAEGQQIRRGIYRDFPTNSEDDAGRTIHHSFELVSATRDGAPETTRIERISNAVRVYLGKADVFLTPGEYTYVITYVTDRQVRRFADHDEVYWNATGTEWAFPILKATATVILPPSGQITETAAYTGSYGSTAQNARAQVTDGGRAARFETTRPLGVFQGLTVAVSFQKGLIAEPTGLQSWLWFLRDNAGDLTAIIGTIAAFMYYLWAWMRVGRDPPKGVMVPRWDLPEGVSPALTHYIWHRGLKSQGFPALSAAAINLAVNGFLTLDKIGDTLSIRRTAKPDTGVRFPVGEAALMSKIGSSGGKLELTKSNGTTVASLASTFRSAMEKEHRSVFYKANYGWIVPGVILSILTVAATVFFMNGGPDAIGAAIGVIVAGTFLTIMAVQLGKRFSAGGLGSKIQAVFILFFVAVTVMNGGLSILSSMIEAVSLPLAIGVLATLVMVNILFFYLLGAPTPLGQQRMTEIEGLRHYLTVAEEDRMNMAGAPEMSPKHYETLLPYAVALDVEKPWSNAFQAWLAAAVAAGTVAATYTGPNWYHGPRGGSISDIGSSMASLPTDLAHSMTASLPTPKSSSSGFSGGGGSSGGGGGGGGGGGW